MIPQWQGFRKQATATLNSHGHALQAAVAKAIITDRSLTDAGWTLECVELPVQSGSHETRIDLVLVHSQIPIIVPIECKRIMRGTSRWLFATFENRGTSPASQYSLFDLLRLRQGIYETNSSAIFKAMPLPRFDIGFAIQSRDANSEHRSPSARGTSAIDEACRQALLGSQGILNLYIENAPPFSSHSRSVTPIDHVLFPIVVTTCELFGIDVPLDSASLETGTLELNESEIRPHDAVCLQYPLSHSFRCDQKVYSTNEGLGLFRDIVLTRTVAIVQSTSITTILRELPWQALADGMRQIQQL